MLLTELSNVHNIVLVLQDCSLVVVHIQIVGRAEDCHDTGESSSPGLPVHTVTRILCFVSSNDREQIVLLEEGACGGIREEIGAAANVVMYEEIVRFLLTELFKRIGPQDVAHQTMGRGLAESVNLNTVRNWQGIGNADVAYALQIFQGV